MNNVITFIQEREILRLTVEHLYLTGIAMGLAIFIGVALGILLSRFQRLATPILGATGVVQTVPSLAMLGFMLPLLGIGSTPAIVALFLYALLPIIRNTYTSVIGVDPALIEAAIGMGMTRRQVLTLVRLPLALAIIMAGIRTSTVICVGIATLCAFIGAGGLGELIFTGISMVDNKVILAGAIPAALLALLLDFLLGRLETFLSPKGLAALEE
jgi:osmoprotectant transport system permease protein